MQHGATQEFVCSPFTIESHENFSFKNTGVSPEAQQFIGGEHYFWSVRHVL